MDTKDLQWTRKVLLAALFLLAISGLLLHYRIHNFMVMAHNPSQPVFDSTHFLAFLFPLIDAVVVTALFASRKTAVFGYVLNGMIVIYGTVFMVHFSIVELTAKSAPIQEWLIKSTLPDIGISWGDFFIGKALYDLNIKA